MSCRIIILGAGISGLATAWFLKQRLGGGAEVLLLEKSGRAGGWIQTIQEEGFLFEQGPRSCRTQGAGREVLALAEELGLREEVLFPSLECTKRYLYGPEGLQRLPREWWEVPFNPLTRGWLRALWRDWRTPPSGEDDESICSFFSRRLGKEWFERLVDPMVAGIYAGDCRRLSLKSCFPLFHLWEKERGSLLRGALGRRRADSDFTPFVRAARSHPLFSFRRGMETLPLALAERLEPHLRLNAPVDSLLFQPDGVEVQLAGSARLKADYLISTLPAFALAPLAGAYPSVSALLDALPYATLWIVHMGFEGSVLPLKGFGYLVPSVLPSWVLGCVWDSAIFPEQNGGRNQSRLTMMLGGGRHPQAERMSQREAEAYALQALKVQMGVGESPCMVRAARAQRAIPQYEVGYALWKQEVEEAFGALSSRFALGGSGWNGVSIGECISAARKLAARVNLSPSRGLCH